MATVAYAARKCKKGVEQIRMSIQKCSEKMVT